MRNILILLNIVFSFYYSIGQEETYENKLHDEEKLFIYNFILRDVTTKLPEKHLSIQPFGFYEFDIKKDFLIVNAQDLSNQIFYIDYNYFGWNYHFDLKSEGDHGFKQLKNSYNLNTYNVGNSQFNLKFEVLDDRLNQDSLLMSNTDWVMILNFSDIFTHSNYFYIKVDYVRKHKLLYSKNISTFSQSVVYRFVKCTLNNIIVYVDRTYVRFGRDKLGKIVQIGSLERDVINGFPCEVLLKW